MKKLLLAVFLLFLAVPVFAEETQPAEQEEQAKSSPPFKIWSEEDTAPAQKTMNPNYKEPPKEPVPVKDDMSEDCRMPPWMRKPGLKCD